MVTLPEDGYQKHDIDRASDDGNARKQLFNNITKIKEHIGRQRLQHPGLSFHEPFFDCQNRYFYCD